MKKLTFSQRIDKTPKRIELQKDDVDFTLKNRLWTLLYKSHLYTDANYNYKHRFYQDLWWEFYDRPIHEASYKVYPIYEYIRERFFNGEPFKNIYEFIEYYLDKYTFYGIEKVTFKNEINKILEEENSAYRIINWEFAQITNETEIKEIEQAANTESEAVNSHMAIALKLFSEKGSKDYKNIIKESISAVEAAAKIVSGKPNATLGDALDVIKKKHNLHTALEQGFQKLYGYTSDKKTGIRHGLIDDTDIEITFEDAKFMLVACSAFVNYLMALKDK